MKNRLAEYNPNICVRCADADWEEEGASEYEHVPLLIDFPARSRTEIHGPQGEHVEVLSLLHQFDDLDEPGAIDFLQAEIAAKKIIAETAAREARALEQKLFDLIHQAPNS